MLLGDFNDPDDEGINCYHKYDVESELTTFYDSNGDGMPDNG
jgi:hypothetical protein